jgi:RNA polymerase sigma-70 factor (ECF subfamily)
MHTELHNADDVALVLALRSGDPRAPRALWRRYARTVSRILYRALGPSNDIEDAVQEVFLVVFKKAGAIRTPAALPAYIRSVAELTSRHELRKRRALVSMEVSDLNHVGAVAAPVDTDARAALVRFEVKLAQLSAVHRAAFVLRFVERLEITQVAAALGVSLATAKRRIARAAAKVRLFVERDPLLATYGACAA